MPTTLNYRGICVQNIDISCHFYTQALGFSLQAPIQRVSGAQAHFLSGIPDAEFYIATLAIEGGPSIQLMQLEKPDSVGARERRPLNRLGLTHLSFNCADLDAICQAITVNNGRVYPHTRAYYDASDCTMIYATDPDGVRLELMDWTGHATGFSHSGICVGDIESSMSFYQALGFMPGDTYDLTDQTEWLDTINELENTQLRALMLPNADNDVIELLRYYSPETRDTSDIESLASYGYNHLAFMVDNLHDCIRQLDTHGARWLGRVTDFQGVNYIHGSDPNGVRLILAERR